MACDEDENHRQPPWLIAKLLPRYLQLPKPVQMVPATMLVAHEPVEWLMVVVVWQQTALDLGKVALVVVDRLQRVLRLQNLVLVSALLPFLHPDLGFAAQM